MWRGGAGRLQHRHGMLLYQALCYSWNLLFLIHGRAKEIWILWLTRGIDIALFHLEGMQGWGGVLWLYWTEFHFFFHFISTAVSPFEPCPCYFTSLKLVYCFGQLSCPVPPLGIQFGLWDVVIRELLCKPCNPEALALRQFVSCCRKPLKYSLCVLFSPDQMSEAGANIYNFNIRNLETKNTSRSYVDTQRSLCIWE